MLISLQLLSAFKLPIEPYEQQQWAKVLTAIFRKSEYHKSRELAETLLKRYEHFERERNRKRGDGKTKPLGRNANDEKARATADASNKRIIGSNVSAGVKRPLDEGSKGASSGAGAPKKAAIGDGKSPNTSSTNLSKSSVTQPSRTGTSSVPGDRKSAGTNSSTASTIASRPKPSAGSGIFRTLQGKAPEQTSKAPAKYVACHVPRFLERMTNHVMHRPVDKKPTTALPQPTSSFTSIFAQLKQRQKEEQDREKGINKASEAAKASEDEKRKRKKTVKWKTGDDLVEVKLIEWLEPEGEYYGGGSGAEHGYGGQLGEGAALKNKDMVDDEDDLVDWYTPPRKLTIISYKHYFWGTNFSYSHQL